MAITGLLPRLMGRERKESVSDPELMDYAIYDMETARRKYMFLLRKRARSGNKHQ